MKLSSVLLGVLALVALPVSAHDLPLRDGTVLKDVRLREKTDLGVRLKHSTHTEFIDYSRIPTPDLYTWGYEKEKYDAAKKRANDSVVAAQEKHRERRTERLYKPTRKPQPKQSSDSSYNFSYQPPTQMSYGGRCMAITQKGFQCSRNAQPGRSYCWQHP